MRKFLNIAFGRIIYTLLLVVFQVALITIMFQYFNDNFAYFYFVCEVVSIAVLLHLIYKSGNPEYKIAWIIPILIFPLFGGILYLIFAFNRSNKGMQKKLKELDTYYNKSLKADEAVLKELSLEDKTASIQSKYIQEVTHTVPSKNTTVKYFKVGEMFFESLKEELKKAEKFIFMEYFIIQEGVMWNEILSILEEKVKSGVEVRLMYDDFGCIFKLPQNYWKGLEKKGIKTLVFHKFNNILTPKFNNRDHRKICVVDGYTGFNGGINLADEYINATSPFGHWKDTAVMLKGAAVWNFTVMFLSLWDYVKNDSEDYEKYAPDPILIENTPDDGYIQPFTDIPLDDNEVGKNVYMNLINKAEKYVYITTPYLVIDNDMLTAMITASKSGVDIRIITPFIGDHWYVHVLSRSYYDILVDAGVKIYEYTPGFVHAKNFVCDDKYAVVGTINLDFRSLYLHYECATWMYKSSVVKEIRDDYLSTIKQCKEINKEERKKKPLIYRIFISVLKAFAPLI